MQLISTDFIEKENSQVSHFTRQEDKNISTFCVFIDETQVNADKRDYKCCYEHRRKQTSQHASA